MPNVLPETDKMLVPSEIDRAVYESTNGAHSSIITVYHVGEEQFVSYERISSDVAAAAASWTDFTPTISGGLTSKRLITGNNTTLEISEKTFLFCIRVRDFSGCTIKAIGSFGEIVLTTNSVDGTYYTHAFTPGTVINWEVSKSGYMTEYGTRTMELADVYVTCERLTPISTSWTYKLTVNTFGCTVKINGTTKTTNSAYGQVFSGGTSATLVSYEVTKAGYTSQSGNMTPSNSQKIVALTSPKYIFPITMINECTYDLGKSGNTQGITISYNDMVRTSDYAKYLSADTYGHPSEIGSNFENIYIGNDRINKAFSISIATRISSDDSSPASKPDAGNPKVYLYAYDRDTYESYLKASAAGSVTLIGSTNSWVRTEETYRTMKATITPDFNTSWTDTGVAFVFKES